MKMISQSHNFKAFADAHRVELTERGVFIV